MSPESGPDREVSLTDPHTSLKNIHGARRQLLRHWETWAAVLLCGVCAGGGGYLSAVYFRHAWWPMLIGGGVGGLLFGLVARYVRRRYGLADAIGGLPAVLALFFRDEPGGRVMVPDGTRSRHGYRVRSPEQERLMQAYLRMRLWAQGAVMLLGLLATWFAIDLPLRWNAMEKPGDAVRLVAIGTLAYFLLLFAPVMWLQRTARKIELECFPAADRVEVAPIASAIAATRRLLITVGIGLLLLGGALLLALHLRLHR